MNFELRRDGYYYDEGNKNLARIQWEIHNDIMTITHTVVNPSLQGRGIARELLELAVDYANEHNYTIDPLCSYADRFLDDIEGGKELRV